jgi:hypothetical protein
MLKEDNESIPILSEEIDRLLTLTNEKDNELN